MIENVIMDSVAETHSSGNCSPGAARQNEDPNEEDQRVAFLDRRRDMLAHRLTATCGAGHHADYPETLYHGAQQPQRHKPEHHLRGSYFTTATPIQNQWTRELLGSTETNENIICDVKVNSSYVNPRTQYLGAQQQHRIHSSHVNPRAPCQRPFTRSKSTTATPIRARFAKQHSSRKETNEDTIYEGPANDNHANPRAGWSEEGSSAHSNKLGSMELSSLLDPCKFLREVNVGTMTIHRNAQPRQETNGGAEKVSGCKETHESSIYGFENSIEVQIPAYLWVRVAVCNLCCRHQTRRETATSQMSSIRPFEVATNSACISNLSHAVFEINIADRNTPQEHSNLEEKSPTVFEVNIFNYTAIPAFTDSFLKYCRNKDRTSHRLSLPFLPPDRSKFAGRSLAEIKTHFSLFPLRSPLRSPTCSSVFVVVCKSLSRLSPTTLGRTISDYNIQKKFLSRLSHWKWNHQTPSTTSSRRFKTRRESHQTSSVSFSPASSSRELPHSLRLQHPERILASPPSLLPPEKKMAHTFASPAREQTPLASHLRILEEHTYYHQVAESMQFKRTKISQIQTLQHKITEAFGHIHNAQINLYAYNRWFREHYPAAYAEFLASFAERERLEECLEVVEQDISKQKGIVESILGCWPEFGWRFGTNGSLSPGFWSIAMLRKLAFLAKRGECEYVVACVEEAVMERVRDRVGRAGVPREPRVMSCDLESVRGRLEEEEKAGGGEEGRGSVRVGEKRKRKGRLAAPNWAARDAYRAKFQAGQYGSNAREGDGGLGEEEEDEEPVDEGGEGDSVEGGRAGGSPLQDASSVAAQGGDGEDDNDDEDEDDDDEDEDEDEPAPPPAPPKKKTRGPNKTGPLDAAEEQTLLRLLRRYQPASARVDSARKSIIRDLS
ncbi:uncharacterized protein MYCFIDRAFT_180733 [Pseudocercospora fijiensis CIRAD86]|uniref:Uncharacterized protein n=1 Tax=Pseudocercospora fijiensis (strain CIRAD86) TaxID=383855 RepID=M2ZXF4_PSEFD|nr:uncharacterized protein MYCFIDRAFT_180733 [Pseudocercospora fijiensis CIRAD86]EME76746.1 hypothetical protein MYCFIDRAFT_180733 [Pseudocercospora fijiensis CIRAD86]